MLFKYSRAGTSNSFNKFSYKKMKITRNFYYINVFSSLTIPNTRTDFSIKANVNIILTILLIAYFYLYFFVWCRFILYAKRYRFNESKCVL